MKKREFKEESKLKENENKEADQKTDKQKKKD